MTAKQPHAGEYWQKEYTRVCVIGTMKNGLTVGETEFGTLISFLQIHDWQHLPDCDSFDWQPEVWPQYWTAINDITFAYCLRYAADKYCMIKRDGSRGPENIWYHVTSEGRTQLTKEQAEAFVDCPPRPVVCSMCGVNPVIHGTAGCKDCTEFALDSVRVPVESPDEYRILREDEQTVETDERMYPDGYRSWTAMTAMDGWESGITVKELRAKFVPWHNVVVRRKVVPPQESPDDWVTQDRVPVRLSDEIHWSGMASRWHKVSKQGDVFLNKLKHGSVTRDRGTLSVRCRRKDLPPVESPERVTVRLLGRRSGEVRWQELDELFDAHDREIKHDGDKFYVEVQP